ncbi:sulfur oxidation c-type cytochrome SoxA [Variovorax sp. PCZ-1]|uniref:sulfur oxidation c-type cytochrome SoxA n=1 Tax=Variovorax sp. PCZ-1 TaxID=2835533 RepID=UPI0020BFA4DF|nr:sulfur oxidation c-type cytochrome SoxA [Variovorax sp. PCZ-1]
MKKKTRFAGVSIALAAIFFVASPAQAQQKSAQDAINEYRQSLQDGNPADLNAARGEGIWNAKRGGKSLAESCDLGLGIGKVKGAVAQLPKYFGDVKKVMDIESRLVHCMVTFQGAKREDFTPRTVFSGEGQRATMIEDLVAFVYDESRGETIKVPQGHALEKASFERGKQAFYFKGGPYDFSCAACHSEDGKRIRLQDLPNLTKTAPAQAAFSQWPAYRVSQGAVRTMQWRLYDCFRQQRFPELQYLSQTSVDLITFMGVNANGGKMAAPAIKR